MKNININKKNSIYKSLNNRFFYKNKIAFTFMNVAALITAFLNIAISWLMQQLVDVASGKNNLFNFNQLFLISLIFFTCFITVIVIKYFAWPGFMKRAMRQYKEFAFEEITGKDITSTTSICICKIILHLNAGAGEAFYKQSLTEYIQNDNRENTKNHCCR